MAPDAVQTSLPLKEILRRVADKNPRPLGWFYDIISRLRPGTARETIRARIYEAMERQEMARVAPGVYYATAGNAQLLVIEGDAWDALRALPEGTIDALVT